MAESQTMCMDDGHVNEKITESNPEFYYSEGQRAALEELLRNGDGAFKDRLKADEMKDFLSAREIKTIRNTFLEFNTDCEDDPQPVQGQNSKVDSGIHSTYWPQLSDVEVPPLDNGWPDTSVYKGVTRVTVHTNPPKENGPRIKQEVRKLIQQSTKVVAVVMDMLTDLQILQDLLDAASKRHVAVYILLDARGLPHFLDMCTRLQMNGQHLRYIRVRTVQGVGLTLSNGKLPGSMCNKYMLVDGDKVVFGSYSFTWSSSRIDRNAVLFLTGHVVDFFDRDFRELYAISQGVDLYDELHVTKAPGKGPAPSPPMKEELQLPPAATRFRLSLSDIRSGIPAHKFYNPKYSLVVGGAPGPTGTSLIDIPIRKESLGGLDSEAPQIPTLRRASSERLDRQTPVPATPTKAEATMGTPKLNGVPPQKEKLPTTPTLENVKAVTPKSGCTNTPSPSPSPSRTSLRSLKFTFRRHQGTSVDEEPISPEARGRVRLSLRGSKTTSVRTDSSQEGDAPKARRRSQKKSCIAS
ncbi:hypothetical protein GJAV_G00142900 [Gymnothorax javanicus]|nr:hypothetical protein GJAV_G00142900 [Gymnothorax javanicus]